MKIAISSTEPNPDAGVDLRFGRCRCFAIVDVDADTYDFIDNDAATLGGGAGLQAAQMVADARVNAVITGNIGPNATSVLEVAGIKTYLCNSGTIREVLQNYRNGLLAEASGHTVRSHYGSGGLGRGGGAGMGRGMGGGMGQGGGGGQGGGMGQGRGGGQGGGMGQGRGGGQGGGMGQGRGGGQGGGSGGGRGLGGR